MYSDDIKIVLTDKDRIVLESYKIMIRGLGNYLGTGYELILHSLENLEHSVIGIVNGFHSGRSEGAPITDFALSMVKKLQKSSTPDGFCYFNHNTGNSTLKSCTIPVTGEYGRIIGLCCINFYCDTPFDSFIMNFMSGFSEKAAPQPVTENFFRNSEELIQDTTTRIKKQVYNDSHILSSNKNREIILRLEQEGIFNMKDAIIQVADILNISRNTVYMHLRNAKKE
jgi:predicted transcriptional regulator YheO